MIDQVSSDFMPISFFDILLPVVPYFLVPIVSCFCCRYEFFPFHILIKVAASKSYGTCRKSFCLELFAARSRSRTTWGRNEYTIYEKNTSFTAFARLFLFLWFKSKCRTCSRVFLNVINSAKKTLMSWAYHSTEK